MTHSISLKIVTYVANHVLSHTVKRFPVASSSLAAKTTTVGNRRSHRFRSKIGGYVASHVLSYVVKGFLVASSSLAARVENDDIRKIDDTFHFAQNRHIGSKLCPAIRSRRLLSII